MSEIDHHWLADELASIREALGDRVALTASDVADLRDVLQKSTVKIETNSRGQAQVKISVVAGETEEELKRISDLARAEYMDLIKGLGTLAKFT